MLLRLVAKQSKVGSGRLLDWRMCERKSGEKRQRALSKSKDLKLEVRFREGMSGGGRLESVRVIWCRASCWEKGVGKFGGGRGKRMLVDGA